jgi:hypothetical protein
MVVRRLAAILEREKLTGLSALLDSLDDGDA